MGFIFDHAELRLRNDTPYFLSTLPLKKTNFSREKAITTGTPVSPANKFKKLMRMHGGSGLG